LRGYVEQWSSDWIVNENKEQTVEGKSGETKESKGE
jgi:hypothetical protein